MNPPRICRVADRCSQPARAGRSAAPSGRKIQAKNGDVILVENADRVGLIRRKEAQVRAIHNPLQRWLVLLVDYARRASIRTARLTPPIGTSTSPANGRSANDGRACCHRRLLDGGGAKSVRHRPVVRDGTHSGPRASRQFTLQGRVCRRNAVVPGSGRAGRASSFDLTEQQEVATVSAGIRASTPAAPASGGQQPIRVGGNIRPPTKTHDVRPVYPDEALQARITGVVILEATIGVDGSVTDAKSSKVFRSWTPPRLMR